MKRFQMLCTIGAALALGACGGDAAVAILGTLGAGGGQWFVDADPSAAGYQRADCGGTACTLTFLNGNLYQRNYAEAIAGNTSRCAGTHAGSVSDAVNVSVPQCFVGRFLNVNEALSTDGLDHLYFDFDPRLNTGVWVDIQDDTHRFVFNGSADIDTGCEFTGSSKKSLDVTISRTNFLAISLGGAPGPVTMTTVQALTIAGAPARIFVGEFVGASGLRLTRSGEKIELQRSDQAGTCS